MDRARAPLDPGRRPHLAAAASRHLLDRGSGAAHPRPQERQSRGADQRQAGVRDRRRHHRRRCRQGLCRPRHHCRTRGRHGREPPHLDPSCRRALGDRPRRDASDAGAERAARPHRGPGRWRPALGPRRHRRGAFGRGRVRLRHRGAHLGGLRHDAEMPSQHLPGRGGDAEPRAPPPLRRQARARHQFLHVHRRGSARIHGGTGLPHRQRDDRSHRPPRDAVRPQPSEGAPPRSRPRSAPTEIAARHGHISVRAAAPSHGGRARPQAHRQGEAGARCIKSPSPSTMPIRNVNRIVGAMLSGEVAQRYGDEGLPDGAIHVRFKGTAGQSFGAFLARGITLELEGARPTTIAARASRAGASSSTRRPTARWRATRASSSATPCSTAPSTANAILSGVAGERFAVRNSGAIAVVEGVGSPWLRIHDRRRGGRARRHRQSISPPA